MEPNKGNPWLIHPSNPTPTRPRPLGFFAPRRAIFSPDSTRRLVVGYVSFDSRLVVGWWSVTCRLVVDWWSVMCLFFQAPFALNPCQHSPPSQKTPAQLNCNTKNRPKTDSNSPTNLLPHSSFCLHPSNFNLPPSLSSIHPSSFILQTSLPTCPLLSPVSCLLYHVRPPAFVPVNECSAVPSALA